MRRVSFIAAALLFVAVSALPLFAQTGAPQTQQGTGKIGVINTQAFYADSVGIAKLLAAYSTLDKEFEPRNTELVTMNSKLESLAKDVQNLQGQLNNAKPQAPIDVNAIRTQIDAKTDEGQRLQIEIKRKQEDGKAAYEKREEVVVGPVRKAIGDAIIEYAKQKGLSMVLDAAKLDQAGTLLWLDQSFDVTLDFIKYFNGRPASTATTTAPAKPATGTAAKPN
jgi:Skp family chaperone for outer membrane proteins